MSSGRSTEKDGWGNQLETYVTTHFSPAWRLAQGVGPVRRQLNRLLVNRAVGRMPPRPNPLSTMAPYTSWASLTDRTFDGRHLPPVRQPVDLPAVERTADLFRRTGPGEPDKKSTLLFAYFAQWFTDGFLRSDRTDLRKNTSNHEIDLCQLYGLKQDVTELIRAHQDGLLLSQFINGEEYPPYLCQDGDIKPEFKGLEVVDFDTLPAETRNGLFAMGGDRTNTQIGFAMMNVLFFREHNRLARLLADEYPTWDDERLFSTARNILNVLLIKIVVEQYINHITPYHFQFNADPTVFRNEQWYRQNWMAVEFNLLYRWHSLVPSVQRIAGKNLSIADTMYNNKILVDRGLGKLFEDVAAQPSGRIGLFNTDQDLREVEVHSIQQGRHVELASYNEYRAACGFPRVTAVNQISGDPKVQDGLRDLYRDVDEIEFYVGLFAEEVRPNSALPALMGRMVGVDAFSQALTNPLLAPRVFNEQTFSPLGMKIIAAPVTLSDLVHRNVPDGSVHRFISMTRQDWVRS